MKKSIQFSITRAVLGDCGHAMANFCQLKKLMLGLVALGMSVALFPAMGAYELSNGNFENTTGGIAVGWTSYGNSATFTWDRDTGTKNSGASSQSAANNGANRFMAIYQKIDTQVGDVVTMTGYVRNNKSSACTLSLRVDPTGATPSTLNAGSTGAATTVSGSWVALSVAGQSTTATSFTTLFQNVVAGSVGTAFTYVDDVVAYHAYVPAAPTVDNPTSSTLDVTVNKASVDPETRTIEYAIQETTGSQYVQANGSLGGTAVWQTRATWGTKTVTGLSASTSYTFKVKSRYNSTYSVESNFGATAGNTTGGGVTTLHWASGNGTWAVGVNGWNGGANFADGDAVEFLDTDISSSPTITLNTAVAPGNAGSGLVFNHATYNYTLTGSGTISISGSTALTKSGAGTLTMGVVSTATGATSLGGGVLVLNVNDGGGNGPLGASGTISFVGGTLAYSANNTVDYSSRFSTAASQAYKVDTGGQNVSWATALTASSSTLTKSGTGTLTLSTAGSQFPGGTTISAGTVKLGAAAVLADSAAVAVTGILDLNGNSETIGALSGAGTVDSMAAGNPTLTIGSGNTSSTFIGTITDTAGTLSVTKTGTGTVSFDGSQSYSGTTTIDAGGAVSVTSGGSFPAFGAGAGNVSLSGKLLFGENVTITVNGLSGTGTVASAGAYDAPELHIGDNNVSGTFAGLITKAGPSWGGGDGLMVRKIGTGTLRLSNNANDFNGACDVRDGVLEVATLANAGTASAIGDGSASTPHARIGLGSGTTVGTLRYIGSGHSSSRGLALWGTSGGGAIDASGSGALTLSGGWTLDFSDASTTRTITIKGDNAGNNTLSGAIPDQAAGLGKLTAVTKDGTGKWILSNDNTYTGDTTVSGGTLQIGAGGAVGSVASASIVDNAALIFNRSDSSSYSGVISGTGSVTKEGAGALTLSGNNTYSGNTTISAGALNVSGQTSPNSGTGTGTVAVSANGTLGGGGRVAGDVSVANNGTVYPNVSGALTLGGDLTFASGGTNKFDLSSTYNGANDQVVLESQTLTCNGATIVINSGGTLDTTTDYTLIDVGASGTLSGSFYATPVFVGTTPPNPGNYSIINDSSRYVKLHYEAAAVPTKLVFTSVPTNPTNGLPFSVQVQSWDAGDVARGVTSDTEVTLSVASGSGSLSGTLTGTISSGNSSVTISTPVYSAADGMTLTATATTGMTELTAGTSSTINFVSTVYWGTGSGTWTAANVWSNVYTAAAETFVNGDTVTLEDTVSGSSPITIALDSSVTVASITVNNPTKDYTVSGSGAIAGTAGLTKSGAGALTLGTPNTYSGNSTLNAGTVTLDAANTAGVSGPLGSATAAGSIVLNGATLKHSANNQADYSSRFSTAASQQYNVDTAGQAVTWASALTSSGGSLTKSGAGTLTLGNANSYTGGSTLGAGTVSLGAAGALGSSGTITLNGGTLQYSGESTDYSSRFSTAASQQYNVDVAGGQAVTWATILSSSGGTLNKSGSGTLTLSGNSTYDGGTTISGGQLNLNTGGSTTSSAIGTGPFTIAGVCTIDSTASFNGPTTTNYWNADFTYGGSSVMNLKKNPGLVVLGGNRQVTVNGSTLQVYATISDGGSGYSLTKAGSGALSLFANANTFSGGVTLLAGTLNVGAEGPSGPSGSPLGTGRLTLSGGGVNNSQTVAFTISTDNLQTWNGSFISSGNSLDLGTGAVTLDANLTVTVNVNTLTVGGIIDDGASTYAMNKAGAGTLSLTAVNTYGGGTTNSAGTILIDGDATLGTGTLTMAGGSLTATAAHASEAAGGIYLTSDGIIGSSAGATTKQLYFGGSVGGDNGTRMLTFTNHANAGAFVARLNGGGFTCGIKLDLQGGSGTISLQLYNTTGTDQQFDGVISGNGNVTRSASVGGTGGRTILTAANTYSGGTAVNDGILLVNNGSGSGTGTGAVTVGSGGTLGGTGAISGAITVGSGGRLAPGTSIGTLTADGNVTLEAGSGTGMEIDRNSGTELADLVTGIDTLTEGGTLYVTNNGATLQIGDEFTLFSATTYSGQFAAFSPANPNSDAELAWDTNALATLGMLKVHHTSYATNKTVVRGSGTSIKIPKAILFPTTDPLDADTVSLASLGASAEGAAITSDSTHILYSPANNNSDSFDYTVGDGRGGNRTATITVDVTNSVGAVTITATNANSMTVAAWAIPGYSYAIERDSNANMSTPETIYTTNLPSNSGLITYTEDPPYPSTFYRIRTN